MSDIRDKARKILEQVPATGEVRSDRDAALFTKLTNGVTHATLMENWKAGGIRTVCIDFVCWYAAQMGIDILSSIPKNRRDSKVDGFFRAEGDHDQGWTCTCLRARDQGWSCAQVRRHHPAHRLSCRRGTGTRRRQLPAESGRWPEQSSQAAQGRLEGVRQHCSRARQRGLPGQCPEAARLARHRKAVCSTVRGPGSGGEEERVSLAERRW